MRRVLQEKNSVWKFVLPIGAVILLAPVLVLGLIALVVNGIYEAVQRHNAEAAQRTDAPEVYITGEYRTYKGGEEAGAFFDAFADTEKYLNLAFHYRDHSDVIAINKYNRVVFVLDVQYQADMYSSLKERILPATEKTAEDFDGSSGYEGNFFRTTVVLEEDLYRENCCQVFFDDQYCTIRYVFLRDTLHEESYYALQLNVSLAWNTREHDLVFAPDVP